MDNDVKVTMFQLETLKDYLEDFFDIREYNANEMEYKKYLYYLCREGIKGLNEIGFNFKKITIDILKEYNVLIPETALIEIGR